MKNQKGVSLITLVITIIVVIILAAIALGGGAADTAGQAQFSGFATEMGGLKESVQTAITTAKGDEAIRGNSRSNAQLANYVARGGANVLTPDASGDLKWLVQSDANTIPCTLIEKTHADKVLGAKLPVRKVETAKGTNQEVSYFVTPKGQVFCWPPYTYDDKSYVTNNVTAKSGDPTAATYSSLPELSGTDATKYSTITLYFPETDEKVIVSNSTDATAFVKDGGAASKTAASVFYNTTSSVSKPVTNANSASGYTVSSGVATGLTFETYKNN